MSKRQYLEFAVQPRSSARKTNIWWVVNKRWGDRLGTIQWYGAWRQYCFVPVNDAVIFSAGCLLEIAAFCKAATDAHRKERKCLTA